MATTKGAHILVIPHTASGHIIPILDLTRHLLLRGMTISITLIPQHLPLLQPLLSAHPSSLHPLFLSPPKPTSISSKFPILNSFLASDDHLDQIVPWFRSHPSPPVAMISDFVLTWTHRLSQLLLMPRIIFSPMGSCGFSVFCTIWRDSPENVTGDENLTVGFKKIPHFPIYPWWQISRLYREYRRGDPDWDFFRSELLESLVSCWGLVINTFRELEGAYLDYLRKEMGFKRLWAVGPLLPEINSVDHLGQMGGPSSMPIHDVLTWLDKWQDSSVVYVCFGTHAVLTRKQKDALAIALEISGVRFIWCIRDQGAADGDLMVDEFKDRVGERGLVIKVWAPQAAILKHPAVGAFITHCGWNSTIEGINAGVRMIAWPIEFDQFINAKLLVEQLGVAVRACNGRDNVPDPNDLAQKLVQSLEEKGNGVKGGTSQRDLHELIKMLNEFGGC